MTSSAHVPKQLYGYSLQFTECLSVLADADSGGFVSVEVLDDIAFQSEGGRTELIQAKSGSGANPVSDGSLELWKSVRNWIDQANSKEITVSKTTFTLYVGNQQKGSLCSQMSDAKDDKEVEAVVGKICARFLTATKKKLRSKLGEGVTEHLEVVLSETNRKTLSQIIARFNYRHGSGASYEDLRIKFGKMAIQESLLENVMIHMAGWVKQRIDTAIEQNSKPIIKVDEFRKELASYNTKLIQQPYLVRFTDESHEEPPDHSSRMYYRQLTLIEAEKMELTAAVTDYLTARALAVRYVQEGTINETSLPSYEAELRHLWSQLKKKWELAGTAKSDVHFGKSLLNDCYLQKTTLQGGEVPTSFMCGSFHSLADGLEIGWHPQFQKLLGPENAAI